MNNVISTIINFPLNTDLDNFVFHYRALFNAHGIKNVLPDNTNSKYEKLHNGIPKHQQMLEQDFKEMDLQLYRMKNDHGNVEVKDIKIMGNKAHVYFKVGK